MKGSVVKSLFNKYLKQRLDKVAWQQKGHLIFEEPREGLLKGFCFNSSGFSANTFECKAFVMPLYVPRDFLVLSYSRTVQNPQKRDWWKYEIPTLEQTAIELAPAMNKADEDFLSRINNAKDFYDRYRKDRKDEVPIYESVAYSAAYAELKDADSDLKDFLSFMKKREEFQHDWVKEIYARTEKLLQSDSEQRKALLKEWAAGTQAAIL